MKKGEKVGINTERKQDTLVLWKKVVADFKKNIPPSRISEKYINDRTNRPYTTRHIYFILHSMNVL